MSAIIAFSAVFFYFFGTSMCIALIKDTLHFITDEVQDWAMPDYEEKVESPKRDKSHLHPNHTESAPEIINLQTNSIQPPKKSSRNADETVAILHEQL
jgi:hypothetical protein